MGFLPKRKTGEKRKVPETKRQGKGRIRGSDPTLVLTSDRRCAVIWRKKKDRQKKGEFSPEIEVVVGLMIGERRKENRKVGEGEGEGHPLRQEISPDEFVVALRKRKTLKGKKE